MCPYNYKKNNKKITKFFTKSFIFSLLTCANLFTNYSDNIITIYLRLVDHTLTILLVFSSIFCLSVTMELVISIIPP